MLGLALLSFPHRSEHFSVISSTALCFHSDTPRGCVFVFVCRPTLQNKTCRCDWELRLKEFDFLLGFVVYSWLLIKMQLPSVEADSRFMDPFILLQLFLCSTSLTSSLNALKAEFKYKWRDICMNEASEDCFCLSDHHKLNSFQLHLSGEEAETSEKHRQGFRSSLHDYLKNSP